MDLSFLTHSAFLVFAGTQAAVATLLLLSSELAHRRLLRRGADPVRTRRSRWVCRGTVAGLWAAGLVAYAVPAYHPLLAESYLREALAAIESGRAETARQAFSRAAEHLTAVEAAHEAGGVGGALTDRLLSSWGGLAAVGSALGTAYFFLGECARATPYLESELARRPSASRTALLSYRLAVCHASGDRTEAAEDALLAALLIDRRYAGPAREHPRLRRIAERLLSRRL